jgi:hypothetical protein
MIFKTTIKKLQIYSGEDLGVGQIMFLSNISWGYAINEKRLVALNKTVEIQSKIIKQHCMN